MRTAAREKERKISVLRVGIEDEDRSRNSPPPFLFPLVSSSEGVPVGARVKCPVRPAMRAVEIERGVSLKARG